MALNCIGCKAISELRFPFGCADDGSYYIDHENCIKELGNSPLEITFCPVCGGPLENLKCTAGQDEDDD